MNDLESAPAATQAPTCDERRYDVDALRVILFALLIWLHYVSLCSWTQEPVPLHARATAMAVISVMHQWRLAALFFLSGMGTAFAFARRNWQAYVRERIVRLLVPLLFATYVLLGGFVNPIDTTKRLLEVFPGIERMPYGHLWFVYNLLIYSLILTPLFVYVSRNSEGRLVEGLRVLVTMPLAAGLVIVPPLLFAASDAICKPWARGEVGMWWEFPRYLLYFAVGYLLTAVRKEYFAALQRMRYALIVLAAVMTFIYLRSQWIFGVPDLAVGGWANQGHVAFSLGATLGVFALELHAWAWCLCIFAWAARLLNRRSRWIAYLNQAIYCSYIIHFNMALLAAAVAYRLKLGYASGLILGMVLQTVLCLAFFEVAKRSRLGQILFGIKVSTAVAPQELTSVWRRRIATASSMAMLCCTVLGLVLFGWQIGKRHFVAPRDNGVGAVPPMDARTYVGSSEKSKREASPRNRCDAVSPSRSPHSDREPSNCARHSRGPLARRTAAAWQTAAATDGERIISKVLTENLWVKI